MLQSEQFATTQVHVVAPEEGQPALVGLQFSIGGKRPQAPFEKGTMLEPAVAIEVGQV